MYAQTNTNVNVKKFNPKVYSPSVYIPCWLIQVPTKLLSNNAKILYGRLAQWANSSGIVYRSCPQLSQELGTGIKSIERHLKELKDVGLIGTFHPQAGGVNHYEFYDHEWMHVELVEELIYKSDPPTELSVPPLNSEGTPPSIVRDINIKEIKRNNINNPLPKNRRKNGTNLRKLGTNPRALGTNPKSRPLPNCVEDNPHDIPTNLIEEWKYNRRRYPVTQTVWDRLNRILLQLRERGIDPIEAFERMVASGWRSIEVSWLEQEIKAKEKAKPERDTNSTEWGNDLHGSWV